MTKTSQCPECGAQASGNFCASCGTALGQRFCTQCGAQATPGARFCTSCGAGLGAGAAAPPSSGEPRTYAGGRARPPRASDGSAGGSNTAWWVAGAMMVVVMVFMLQPILSPAGGGSPAPAQAGGPGPGVTDISSMTPREAADRLYNRVMTAVEVSDSQQVNTFLPMAIQSYEMARPLDLDGLFHLARLQRVGVMDGESLATAEEALARNPDYLLALYAAGDAALALGQDDTAREYLGRLIEVWDAQMASGNQDYELHSSQMPGILEFAREAVGGG